MTSSSYRVGGLDFSVTKQDDGTFCAFLADRACGFDGATEHEAIANLVQGAAELARAGHIDPRNPKAPGVPPLQHVLTLLQEKLAWHVEQRGAHIRLGGPNDPFQLKPEALKNDQWQRHNEVISGLATAVAALARVKEL